MTAPPDPVPPAPRRLRADRVFAPDEAGRPRVVHVLSMHTSPLAQPGDGDAGGMNVYVARLCAALARAGHRVEVFTLDAAPGPEDAPHPAPVPLAPGVRVHAVRVPGAAGAAKEELPRFAEAFGAACARLARDLPAPDLLHAHYWLSGVAALALRRGLDRPAADLPLVLTLHTTARIKNRHAGAGEAPEPQARAEAEEALLGAAQAVIVNTRTEAAELAELYGADPARLHVVPPGVDTAVFRPDPGRGRAQAEPGTEPTFRILFAGRPQPLKGPEILLRALPALLAEVPGARLEIRGTAAAPYLEHLRGLARDLGVARRCAFAPASAPAELAAAMRAADVVACPSSSETFGLVALEAQACGTPVAASDVGGLRTALDHGRAGLLVPERTPDAWAAALARLAGDPALRQGLRERGLAHARRLTWDDAARRTDAVYARLLPAPIPSPERTP